MLHTKLGESCATNLLSGLILIAISCGFVPGTYLSMTTAGVCDAIAVKFSPSADES